MIPAKEDVSVIIYLKNNKNWPNLLAAIRSIEAQTVAAREIIVVTDYNLALFARVRRELPTILAVENFYTKGLAGARSSGIVAAQAAIVAFLDVDAIAAPDWLEELTANYADPAVIAVGGTTDLPAPVENRPPTLSRFYRLNHCTAPNLNRPTGNLADIIGCNMSLRHSVFNAVGEVKKELSLVKIYLATNYFGKIASPFSSELVVLLTAKAQVKHAATNHRKLVS